MISFFFVTILKYKSVLLQVPMTKKPERVTICQRQPCRHEDSFLFRKERDFSIYPQQSNGLHTIVIQGISCQNAKNKFDKENGLSRSKIKTQTLKSEPECKRAPRPPHCVLKWGFTQTFPGNKSLTSLL